MQGVEVNGTLIWSIYREADGPFRCYKSFGDDLNKKTPAVANAQLQSMAVSIIRDRIANMTLIDVRKNRNMLRDGVKDQMQKIVTGWGIWVETVEVIDIRIASKSLFLNLQTEFREKNRMEAERIKADTDKIINQEAIARSEEYNKIKTESDVKMKIFQAEQTLAVQKSKAELFTEELKISKIRQEAENLQEINTAELANTLNRKKLQFAQERELYNIELQINKETEKQKLKKEENNTEKIGLEKADLIKQQEFAHMRQMYKIQSECFTENVMKNKLLETTKSIYEHLNISEMKVINMGGTGSGNEDPAGQLIG